MIGKPLLARLTDGTWKHTWYGVGADHKLRPLRDDPDIDVSVETELHEVT
jgi:hypothetical protein